MILTDPDYPGLRIRNQVEKYVQNCKHAFVDRKDAIGKKKLGIAEANKEAVKKAIENVVTFSNQEESISWKEFLELDIIGDKKKRLKRRLKKYLKKYDGTFYGTDIQEDTQKIIIALRRN